MSSNWQDVILDDIVVFLNSKRVPLSSLEREKIQGIYPYYGASGIVDYINDYAFDSKYLLISEDGENLKTRNTPIAFFADGKYWVNNHAHILDEKEEGILEYLKYYFSTLNIMPYLTGAVQPKLNKKTLSSIPIKLPEKNLRLKINHILSTLDDKIELNRKINQTLEEMSSAIFKSWFVDFDPVHAKANCTDEDELENIAKELGISKAILDLFPSEFEESELGMIPKGWEDTELSQICKIQSGYAFKSAWWQDTGVKVIKIKNIDGNRVNTLDCECVSEEIATKNSNFKLSSGDMLIAMTGATVGKVGVIYTADEEYLLNQRVGRFQPIAYYDEYVKIFANSSKFFQSIQGQAQGSAQPNISAREIESVKIIKPNDEIIKTFSLLLNPFFSKILEHQGEIQTLEKTRDTLLPKLFSGEIEV